MALLEVRGLNKQFGGLRAVDQVNLAIEEGEACGLVGPNGAGKTTLFNCIAGYFRPTSGKVIFNGVNITGWSAAAICKLGLARTFQIPRVFPQMTVLENVVVGSLLRHNSVSAAQDWASQVLEELQLADKADYRAGSLTVADLKRLEIARALATRPKMLLLDETLSGLTPTETQDAVRMILEIRNRGITILMVEHVMEALLPIVSRLVVLDSGRIIADGLPRNVLKNEQVVKAYLGGEEDVTG